MWACARRVRFRVSGSFLRVQHEHNRNYKHGHEHEHARALTRDLRPKLSVGGDGGVYIEAACYLLTVGLERELSNTCDLPTALSGYYAYTDVQNRAHSAPC